MLRHIYWTLSVVVVVFIVCSNSLRSQNDSPSGGNINTVNVQAGEGETEVMLSVSFNRYNQLEARSTDPSFGTDVVTSQFVPFNNSYMYLVKKIGPDN